MDGIRIISGGTGRSSQVTANGQQLPGVMAARIDISADNYVKATLTVYTEATDVTVLPSEVTVVPLDRTALDLIALLRRVHAVMTDQGGADSAEAVVQDIRAALGVIPS